MRAALRTIFAVIISAGFGACANPKVSPTAPTTAAAPAVVGQMLIKGTVSDTVFRSLEGARIIVTNGPEAGKVAISDARGEFALIGAFDDSTRFEAIKAGFTAGIAQLQPFCERCNPQRWVHFALDVPAEPAAIAGTYDLTIAVDASCPSIATHLRQRQFTATIPANSRGYFPVQLSGAEFGYGSIIEGGVSGNYVSFYMEGFAERLSANAFMIFSFTSATTIESSPRIIDAVGGGDVMYCELPAASGDVLECYRTPAAINSVCRRENHHLILTRR